MASILLAAETCFDALRLLPLQRALRAAGIRHEVALFADAAELEAARRLGLHVDHGLWYGARDEQQDIAWMKHAKAILERPWRAVLTMGTGAWPRVLGEAAAAADHDVIRLEAGVRAHCVAADDNARCWPFDHNASRRIADRPANWWCAPSDWERGNLVHEGRSPARVFVTGSLLEEAVAGATRGAATHVCLAIEHERTVARVAAVRRLLDTVASLRQAVVVVGVAIRAAIDAYEISLPEHVVLAPSEAESQLDAALRASTILTDSIGHQELALAAGIPFVAVAHSSVLPAAVAAGTGALADARTLAECTRRMLATPRRAARTCTAATAVIHAVEQIARREARPAAISLPSDGDASGRTLGEDEIALVAEVIRRGTLNSTRGTMVTAFEKRFASWLGRKHAIACASGSAAVHCAIAALRLQPGDEVITTPITDMGAITPILYEGAVPVFADVDPVTLNVTIATVKAQLTDRTRAIVVTHLFGCPCDLDGLGALAKERGVALIEDSAQAFGATWRDKKVGTFGALGTFSLQQGKHITTGEGGIVATDDDELARRVFLYVNKAWGYGDKKPDHYFPALNYRLTELQGAVALAQLPKLDGVVAARRAVAAGLQQALADVPGLTLPHDPAHGAHSWWKFAFHVDSGRVPGGPRALAQKLQAAGIACAPHYIQKPAFACELFRDWRASPVTWLPLQHNPRRDRAAAMFDRDAYPGALGGLDSVVVLPINERYTPEHVEHVANAIRAAVGALQHA